MQQMGDYCFPVYSLILCHYVWIECMFINDYKFIISVIFQCEWLCVSLPRVLLNSVYLLFENLCLTYAFLCWCFPFSKAGYLATYFLCFRCL